MLSFLLKYITLEGLIWGIVLAPLVTSAINWLIALVAQKNGGGKNDFLVGFFGVLGPVVSFFCAMLVLWILTGFEGSEPTAITGPLFSFFNFPDFSVSVGLKADQLSLVMAIMVSGVGSLIHIYSIGYMEGDGSVPRYFAELNLFLFFMLLLVMADNLLVMFVGWEGVGLCSYLLIGFWFNETKNAAAGTKAFIVNRIGDFGFLIGLMMIFQALYGERLVGSDLFAFDTLSRNSAFLIPSITVITLSLFFGATGKSAQIPLYVWLPDAMAGPTPVSALIHAATMVTAGVYMVARLSFLYVLSPTTMSVIAFIGCATALFAAIVAVTQNDLKKILAYSTISQLGLMFMAEGVGAFSASIYHLIIHAFFKGGLFLAAGCIIHALHGEQNIFKMGGLKKKLPGTAIAFTACALAIAGIWPTAGFFSKDEIVWAVYSRGDSLLFWGAFITSGLTSFYIFRALALVFFGKSRVLPEKLSEIKEQSVSMLTPTLLLALLAVGGGALMIPLAGFIAPQFVSSVMEVPRRSDDFKHILMLVMTLWNIHWGLVASIIYVQKPSWPIAIAKKFKLTFKALFNGLYVNDLYKNIITRPLYYFSENVLGYLFDGELIDNVVINGSARSVGLLGTIVRRAQTGSASFYLLIMAIGVAIILLGVL